MRWHWPSQPLLISEFAAVSCCGGKAEIDNTNRTVCQAWPPKSLNIQEWEGASLHGNCRSKIIGHGPDCVKSYIRKRGFSSPFSPVLFLTLAFFVQCISRCATFLFFNQVKNFKITDVCYMTGLTAVICTALTDLHVCVKPVYEFFGTQCRMREHAKVNILALGQMRARRRVLACLMDGWSWNGPRLSSILSRGPCF